MLKHCPDLMSISLPEIIMPFDLNPNKNLANLDGKAVFLNGDPYTPSSLPHLNPILKNLERKNTPSILICSPSTPSIEASAILALAKHNPSKILAVTRLAPTL